MSSLPADVVQQLRTDTRAIVTEGERLTGLKSTWSGNIVIGTELDASGFPLYLGAKPWNCDIALHQSRFLSPDYYSTLVHEAFHSVSAGLNKPDYDIFDGYEEGVVEQSTRLFRMSILANASLPAPTYVRTSYRSHVIQLEALRLRTQKAPQDFTLELLKIPLRDREARIITWIQSAEPTKTLQQIEEETVLLRTSLKPSRRKK